jgi:eukaryotic-like serine/threonine-protein kinase
MECPNCHTQNPATAPRCVRCDTPIDLNTPTLMGPDEEGPSQDANLTLENWSAPVTAPSELQAPAAGQPLQPGNLLASRYEILERLGGGGMGTVYKAHDREVDRVVALKVIRAELAGDSNILARFKQELILARKITHKNVIRIFDLGRASGTRFITMEYVEGEDLRSLVKKEGRPAPQVAVEIMQQVCNALEAAHAEGIVHRDLKPQNIMVDAQRKVYVMDFGIARSVGSEGMTMTGELVGTPDYMSPEQVRGEHVDCRSDIFSLGIIFYELLSGKMPYRGETVQKAMYKRTVERAAPVVTEEPSVPSFLSEVVAKCLEIDVTKRYQTIAELSKDLDAWRTGAADQTSSVLQRRLRRVLSNRAVLVGAAVLLALGAGTVLIRRFAPTTPTKSTQPAKPAMALAVIPFRNASGDPKLDWLGSSLGEMLGADVGQSGALRTVAAARVSQVYNDLRIQPDTNLDSATVDRLADFTNADLVIYGQYAKFGDQFRIDATLLDRKNARQSALKVEAGTESEILKSVDQLAKQVRDSLALSSSAIAELQTTAFKPSSQSLAALRDYDQGQKFQRTGKYLQARDSFQAAVTADPNFALAYSGLAESFADMGQDEQAQSYSLKAVNLSDKLPQQERFLINARHNRILKDYPKAIQAYETLAKSSPGDTGILFQLADLYESVGNFDNARSSLETIQSLDPKDPEVLLARGRIEIKSNQPEKGLEFLSTALNLAIQLNNEEQKADILQAMGIGYFNMHRLEEALRSYQDSLAIKQRLALKKGVAASLASIANVQVALGKPEEALKNYNEALKVHREIGNRAGVGDSLIDLGYFYMDRGQPEKALPLFKESLQIQIDLGNDRQRALVLNNIGNIYSDRGETQDAHTYYEQALQLREKFNVPDDLAETLHNLAETDATLGLYDQAIDRYHRALDLRRQGDNKQMIAIETSALGTVFGFQGRYGAALASKEEALKTLRDIKDQSFWIADALAGYGNALAAIRRPDEARDNLEQALRMSRDLKDPNETAVVLGFLGDNAFYAGDLASARQFYVQASQSAAHSADHGLILTTKFNLAKIAVDQGHPAENIAVLRSIQEQAGKSGPKFLATQSAIWLGKSYLLAKDPAKAREVLQSAVLQAEKLGLSGLKAQGHSLLSAAIRKLGNSAEADAESKAASQIFDQIQAEAHFDPRTRHDFVLGSS